MLLIGFGSYLLFLGLSLDLPIEFKVATIIVFGPILVTGLVLYVQVVAPYYIQKIRKRKQ
jgi:hypothetical protein